MARGVITPVRHTHNRQILTSKIRQILTSKGRQILTSKDDPDGQSGDHLNQIYHHFISVQD